MICAIVETRQIPNIRYIVENHVYYSGFKPMVFHGSDNSEYVKEQLQGLGCTFFNIGVNELSADGYNRLLTSSFFWEHIPAEKVLIFQHDSLLLRKGIDEYLQYDFIGAPLYHIDFPCMNGGLSLRSKSKMLEVIAMNPYSGFINEDMYFCICLREMVNKNMPTKEVAQSFSVETIFGLGSFGVHAIYKWFTEDQCREILNQYQKQRMIDEKQRLVAQFIQNDMDKL